MSDEPGGEEYAPLYTTRERLVLALRAALILGPVFLIAQFWFFDWIRQYAENANCRLIGGITGVHLLMYAVFVLIPLSTALLVWLLLGRRALRVLQVGQDPLPGEKVLYKTRYKRGRAARLRSYLLFGMIAIFITMGLWGGFQAERIIRSIPPCSADNIIN